MRTRSGSPKKSRWGFLKMSLKRRSHTRPVAWERLSDDQLLSLRFCDLKLRIAGTELQHAIGRLYRELSMRGMRFRPHCWLAQEWFSRTAFPASPSLSISPIGA